MEIMSDQVIQEACSTGNWEVAERMALREASDELEKLTRECLRIGCGLRGAKVAEQCFDVILRALDDKNQDSDVGFLSSPLLRAVRMASAYEKFVLEDLERKDLEKTMFARKVRHVVVIFCIRVAGTHNDRDEFAKAVLLAFRKKEPPTDRKDPENTDEERTWTNVWAQIFFSYGKLLPVAAGGFVSKSQEERPNRRPRKNRSGSSKSRIGDQDESETKTESEQVPGRKTSVEQRRSRAAPRARSTSSLPRRRMHVQFDEAVDSLGECARDGGDSDRRSRRPASPCPAPLLRRMEDEHRAERVQWKAEREHLQAQVRTLAECVQELKAIVQQGSVTRPSLEDRTSNLEGTLALIVQQLPAVKFQ